MLGKAELKIIHLAIMAICIGLAVYFLASPEFKIYISNLKNFGYLGALVSGFFFSSMLTTAPATASLFILGKSLNPLYIAIIGATGAMAADFLLFTLIRHKLSHHYGLFDKLKIWAYKQVFVRHIKRHKLFRYSIPLLGALIIASPLPDELGIALLGASKYENKKFFLLSWSMNFLGIFAIAYLGNIS